jgi:hypothetical protein
MKIQRSMQRSTSGALRTYDEEVLEHDCATRRIQETSAVNRSVPIRGHSCSTAGKW